ncbi:iron ABC transporter substrate-binding protein [Erysipelothrix larvae]|uniref:Iron ABC transporter substrate-binding protein n=1 Tax=Erysipelothrix larvae TaxID=1514105 RepID=A0A0X8H103_9FIRM|nr:ABC transporter substrate-binding protein [Erysipelothrix larvae]AMC94091.1 iron ABC transporter substrate-binding protein [Erysipelothrix larvae]
MKRIIKAFTLVLCLSLLSACGSSSGTGDKESNTLTLYSPHPAETINLIVKEFQEKTGIQVDVVAAGTGELLKRVESEDGQPLGDVLWGGGAESLAAYTDYFEAYESPELKNIDSIYYDPAFKWIGESPLPMVLMYNTNLVSESDAPTSWNDVLNPAFKGQIAMADPAKSGSAYTIMATMIQAFGKDDGKGWDFMKQFYANLDGKILTSSSGVYKGVADGEYALGLTLEKEAVKYVASGAPVKIVYPEEGTSAIPDGVAIIKDAKNLDNAKKFVDFVLSTETQEIMSSELSRRSIRKDAKAPEGLIPLADIKLVDYDFDWAAMDKDAILKQWKDIVVGE